MKVKINLENSKKLTPYFVLVFGIFAVSSASILIKNAQSEAPSLVIAAFRLCVASLVLGPIVFFRHRGVLKAKTQRERWLLFLSGLFLAVHFGTWITSLEYTSIASSVVLVTTTPIWVAIFSPILLKEKITWGVWLGIFITITGSILVSLQGACGFEHGHLLCSGFASDSQLLAMLGNFLALCGAWAAAGYIIIRRKVSPGLPITAYIFYVYLTAAILLVVVSLGSGISFTAYSPNTYLWMILLGLVPQLLGHSSFNYALSYLPAAYVSVALVGEPIGAIVLAFVLLSEIPKTGDILGGGLILLGIIIISVVNNKNS